ncbi:hypothetical protein SK3146_03865 [Paenibacillus konkukensis]|uniref:Uncharacterized protein n=1 Tax=Paenibacillus konkukensis TaxID=2020716 RepID=A0ABY4RRJ9_9BACL|nr:hypothetical protein SK3146_03865 [Paenibacillus konkukensis]
MGVFKKYKLRKLNGEVLNIAELTSKDLKFMFIDENKSD